MPQGIHYLKIWECALHQFDCSGSQPRKGHRRDQEAVGRHCWQGRAWPQGGFIDNNKNKKYIHTCWRQKTSSHLLKTSSHTPSIAGKGRRHSCSIRLEKKILKNVTFWMLWCASAATVRTTVRKPAMIWYLVFVNRKIQNQIIFNEKFNDPVQEHFNVKVRLPSTWILHIKGRKRH